MQACHRNWYWNSTEFRVSWKVPRWSVLQFHHLHAKYYEIKHQLHPRPGVWATAMILTLHFHHPLHPPDESPKVPLAFFANGKWDGFWQAARQQYQEVVRLPSLSTLAIHWVEERGRKEATKCYFWCYWMLWHCHLKMMADTDITQCWKMFWCHYHDLEHLSVGEKMTGQDNETEVQENSHWL